MRKLPVIISVFCIAISCQNEYQFELYNDNLLLEEGELNADNDSSAINLALKFAATNELVQMKGYEYDGDKMIKVDSIFLTLEGAHLPIGQKDYQFLDSVIRPEYYKNNGGDEYFELLKRDSAISYMDSVQHIEDSLFIISSKNRIRLNEDEFSDKTFIYPRSAPQYVNYNAFYLYYSKGESWISRPRLKFQFQDDDWLFIQNIVVSINGERNYTISPLDVDRDHSGGNIWEWFDIPVISNSEEESMLIDIQNATSVKIKINGSQYYKVKSLSQRQIRDLKMMFELWQAESRESKN